MRTKRVKLTPDRIAKSTCPSDKKQSFIRDTESPKLAVRVTAAGAKSFIFEGKLNRKTIRITIGDIRVWLLDEARKEANRLQALIDQDIDPRELKQEQRDKKEADRAAKVAAEEAAKARQKYTLKALCEVYVRYLSDQGKEAAAAAARSAFKCHIWEPYPEIGNRPANEVTSRQVADILRRVKEQGKKRMSGVLRSYLAAAFNAAKASPYDSELPAAMIPFGAEHNPVEATPAVPIVSGQRHLSADELKAYISHLGEELPDLALKLALYAGGQRMAQLLRAKISDYDPEANTLRIWDGKGKRETPREHILPLGPKAAAIVDNLCTQAEKTDSNFLFASRGSTVYPGTPGKRVREISALMGGEPFDLRDIRRTVETMLAGLKISKDIRAQLLSHGISGVQDKHYDRYEYVEEKRAALRKWERHLKRITSDKPASKVVKLRGA
jgi:integrase